ncbi:MAG: hypothetical protein ACO37W_13685 [Prochlorotrichaceae cyanobacterium]
MNEELVLHILNTACYGLNLHFSIIPQSPYLYIFFDRSPEAVLNYPTLTETIRLAAASAGLPPEYEYLALYSRVLGEADPDWETAIYLYQETQPQDIYEPQEEAAQPENQELPEVADEVGAEFADDLEQANAAENPALPDLEPPSSAEDEFDNITVDPTIVFEDDLPLNAEPALTEESGENTIDTIKDINSDIDNEEIERDRENDEPVETIESLPLPPPPPSRAAAKKSELTAPVEPVPQPKEDDMAQFYFKAKPKPKAAPPPAKAEAESTPLPAPEPPVAVEPVPTAPTAIVAEAVDLSSYCFIRNKLMLSSSIKPPSPEVVELIASLHNFPAAEQNQIATLLDQLYRQPEKNDESSGESALYQPNEIDVQALATPIQTWFQSVMALEPEPFRKSAIWFSRYCHNPQKTMEELGLPL